MDNPFSALRDIVLWHFYRTIFGGWSCFLHWTFATALLIRACPCVTKNVSGEPNTPPDIRRRESCHIICKQRQWICPVYDGLWNGSQMDKTASLVGSFQTSIHGRFSTDKRERKRLLPLIVSHGLRIGLLLRHNPFISQRSNCNLFFVDYAAAIQV